MADHRIENQTEINVNDQLEIRKRKLSKWLEMGIQPYGQRFEVTHHAAQIVQSFDEVQGQDVRIAGRVMAIRGHGKACFADLQDVSGRIQIYAKKDVLEDEYDLFCFLDIGDIIGVTGQVFKTHRGEITVGVQKFALLSKSLRPLPEKWHGLKDIDLRYRQRYLDLIVNPEVRETFVQRSRIVRAIRHFLDSRGFLEVETPSMQPIAGGASARPFITHHNALDIDLYLRIALELYLKRLIIGGMEKVYEIGRCFRNEGISTKHNPEFTMLEAYWAYADYTDIMRLTEELVCFAADQALGKTRVNYQGHEIDLTPPWPRITLRDAIMQYSGIDIASIRDDGDALEVVKHSGLKMDKAVSKGTVIDKLLETFVEPNRISPTFVLDYPVEVSPLAKRREDDASLTYRFEAFAGGREIANAFSELNDPIDQKNRFLQQIAQRAKGDEEAHVMDEDYITAMEYGMPPCGGLGIGIDRLVMLLTDQDSIRDVILFPLMRPK